MAAVTTVVLYIFMNPAATVLKTCDALLDTPEYIIPVHIVVGERLRWIHFAQLTLDALKATATLLLCVILVSKHFNTRPCAKAASSPP